MNTRELVVEEGGFVYDSDAYNDDLPYFVPVNGSRHLVIPYSPDVNDIRFWMSPGFVTDEDFFQYARAAFDVLYAEGATTPKMMSIGLHLRIIGRPGRFRGLERFLQYANGFPGVWFARRIDIARWWIEKNPESSANS